MPFITPSVSPPVLEQIKNAEEMHSFIQKTVPGKFIADTDQKLLVAALFSLVIEHHGAILYLLKAGQFDGSAAALVRPLIDTAYRAHWIYACAKPDIVLRIKNGEENVYPGLINMATEIEKKVDAGGFFALIGPSIKAFHGYTHSGLEQLGRRFDDAGNVKPNYSDEEKVEIVKVITAHFTALAVAWCQLISNDPPEKEPKSKAIMDFYNVQCDAASKNPTSKA